MAERKQDDEGNGGAKPKRSTRMVPFSTDHSTTSQKLERNASHFDTEEGPRGLTHAVNPTVPQTIGGHYMHDVRNEVNVPQARGIEQKVRVTGEEEKAGEIWEDLARRAMRTKSRESEESERYQKFSKISERHVKTTLYHEVLDKLDTMDSLTVLGNAGDGKTTLLNLVCLEYSARGYLTIQIDRPEDIDKFGDTEKPVLFVCDNLLGRIVMDHDKKKSWINCDCDTLISHTVKVLFACRIEQWRENETELEQNPLFKDTVDVRSKKLTRKDKTEMIDKHLGDRISHHTKELIVEDSNFAFPLCCSFVSRTRDTDFTDTDKLVQTFTNPFRFVMATLQTIEKKNKRQFATLVLCLLNERKLPTTGTSDIVKQPNFEVVRNLYLSDRPCSVEQMYDELLDKANEMDGWLLTEMDDYYDFYHDSIFEAVCRVHGARYPEHILNFCRPQSVLTVFATKQVSGSDRVYLPPRCYPELCEIVTGECVNERVWYNRETWKFVFAEMKTADILKQWHNFLSQRLSGVSQQSDVIVTNPRLADVLLLVTEIPFSWLTVDVVFECAVGHGDSETARLLIDFGVTSDGRGRGLVCAAGRGLSDTVRMVVERGDLEMKYIERGLEEAVRFDRVECVREMLRVCPDTDIKQFVFNWAADNGHIGIARMVVKQGDVNTEEKALHEAVESDIMECAPAIMAVRLDTDTNTIQQVFNWAVRKGHIDTARLILKRRDLDMRDIVSGLEEAVRSDRVECVREIMRVHPDTDTQKLHRVLECATGERHVDIVTSMVERGDLDITDMVSGLEEAVRSDIVECVREIMWVHLDTDTQKLHRVLECATGERHVDIVTSMVERGDLYRRYIRRVLDDRFKCVMEIKRAHPDINKDTIHKLFKCVVEFDRVECVREIMRVRPDPGAIQRLLNWPERNEHSVIEKLILERRDLDRRDIVSDRAKCVRETMSGPDTDADKLHRVLEWATGKGHSGIVKMVVERGDLDMEDIETGLARAVESDRVECIRTIVRECDIDRKKLHYVLVWAVGKGHSDIVRMVIHRGDLDIWDIERGLEEAVMSDKVKCVSEIMTVRPDIITHTIHRLLKTAVRCDSVHCVCELMKRDIDTATIHSLLGTAVECDSVNCLCELIKRDIDTDTIHRVLKEAVWWCSAKTIAELVKHQDVSRDYVQTLLDTEDCELFDPWTSQSDRDETCQLLSEHLNTDT